MLLMAVLVTWYSFHLLCVRSRLRLVEVYSVGRKKHARPHLAVNLANLKH